MVKKSCGTETARSRLSKVKVTSALFISFSVFEPAKITSSMLSPRKAFELDSPKTQRIASLIFDLPEPLGPMIATTPPSNFSETLSAKDLNPCASTWINFILISFFLYLQTS